jgi:hypothetical protein
VTTVPMDVEPEEQDPDAPEPLSDGEFLSIVEQEIRQAINADGSLIASDQQEALEFYEGKPFGNEVDGSSKVVMRTVAETVDWAMPSLMRMVFYTNEVVRYEDATPESEQAGHGRRMTLAINEIFRQHLRGFRVVHDWAKAGMLEKFSTVKFWVEEVREPSIETIPGLTEDQVALLGLSPEVQSKQVEYIDHEERAQPILDAANQPIGTMQVFDVRIKRWKRYKRVRLETVPPEEFLCSQRATKLDQQIDFVAQRRRITRSELVSLGIPRALVASVPAASLKAVSDSRAISRRENETPDFSVVSRADKASQEVIATESYIRVDKDGDGYSELRRVVTGGEITQVLLEDDYAEMHGFAGWTPYPMPHKLYGRDAKDIVGDLQEISSTLLRQLLDNIYRMNNARHKIKPEYVDLDSYYDGEAGAPVLVEEMDAIEAMEVPPLPSWGFDALKFVETVKEQRSGIHPYSQESYAAGQNQTASGVSTVFEAAMAQLQLLCQHLAGGLEDLFRNHAPRIMKARGHGRGAASRSATSGSRYDPQQWPDEMRVAVQVGLSPGQTEQRIQRLIMIARTPEGGARGLRGRATWCSPDQIYHTAERIVEQCGYQNPLDGVLLLAPGQGAAAAAARPDADQGADEGPQDAQSGAARSSSRGSSSTGSGSGQEARLERESMRAHEREPARRSRRRSAPSATPPTSSSRPRSSRQPPRARRPRRRRRAVQEQSEPEEPEIEAPAHSRAAAAELARFRTECMRLLDDPATKQILAKVRADIRRESENSKPEERKLREHCYYLLNAVVRIERALRHFGGGGKLSLVTHERSRGGSGSAA